MDSEEQGVYMIPDGAIPTSTGNNHEQGSDSVGAATPGRLLVTGRGLHSFTLQLNLSRFGHTSPYPPV